MIFPGRGFSVVFRQCLRKSGKGAIFGELGKTAQAAPSMTAFPRVVSPGIGLHKEEEKNENSAVHLMSRGQKKRGAAIYAGGVFWNDGARRVARENRSRNCFVGAAITEAQSEKAPIIFPPHLPVQVPFGGMALFPAGENDPMKNPGENLNVAAPAFRR